MFPFSVTIIFFLTLLLLNTASVTINSKAEIYEKVGQYLREQEQLTKQQQQIELENSNKIGLGFNPVLGTPVCYTGTCQMEGFGHPVFKLIYESNSHGSCTTKLIPKYVLLDCLPGSATSASSEVIQTLEQLSESISDKIEIGIGASYKAFSFGYKTSKETSYMV
ncbi:unnamed protein product [Didymodactylos carnosus]|uniref:Uncharacterized protein n=1 Tax=Didymodactylos carnosus TaxID=1234261 RepID=A0A814J211_9BILA|nr:unnamed protein product [Didymodactylos carnosus]CAF3803017.1 unnamed protein product [Didymodactylos carnosus]